MYVMTVGDDPMWKDFGEGLLQNSTEYLAMLKNLLQYPFKNITDSQMHSAFSANSKEQCQSMLYGASGQTQSAKEYLNCFEK